MGPLPPLAVSPTRLLPSLLVSLRRIWGLPDGTPLPLDHDPALILRKYNPRVKEVAARYTPHAHSPDHLIYRRQGNHDEKTFGRKEGAERTVTTKGSDVYLKAKFDRLEGRTKGRPKRAWPKGQKLQSRGFQKRKFTKKAV